MRISITGGIINPFVGGGNQFLMGRTHSTLGNPEKLVQKHGNEFAEKAADIVKMIKHRIGA